jgi:hypothetical protein
MKIKISLELIDDSGASKLVQTSEMDNIEITRYTENRLFKDLDHKATYTAFQFWQKMKGNKKCGT